MRRRASLPAAVESQDSHGFSSMFSSLDAIISCLTDNAFYQCDVSGAACPEAKSFPPTALLRGSHSLNVLRYKSQRSTASSSNRLIAGLLRPAHRGAILSAVLRVLAGRDKSRRTAASARDLGPKKPTLGGWPCRVERTSNRVGTVETGAVPVAEASSGCSLLQGSRADTGVSLAYNLVGWEECPRGRLAIGFSRRLAWICTFPEASASCGPSYEAFDEPPDFWPQARHRR